MGFATDGFESDIRTLSRYGIGKVELPVQRVKDIIDFNDVMANRLRSLCPIKEDDSVTIKTSSGEKSGHVTSIFIRCEDGLWDIATDVYDDFIDFREFENEEDEWYAEVE